ncbi:flagellar export protein FliJ [Buchnera aphidicola (Aphis nasturtii)]|uniref:flagellar export protein FliJ n=1 Tax=Buchnera aphidicola TaxID=9 RepID=UPI0010C4AECF|nr:flagellar FliJ family protein [Buchnera aphidicola]QCI18069.1 flagellar export protein FliJ [Buchnera aphidicola (Aphis nasturtii)]
MQQLKLLINFRNEYIAKLNINLKLGMYTTHWKIYNNFIFMLYIAIEENNNIIKKYENKIKNNIDQWFKNHIKLKTWNYLNQKNKIAFKNSEILKENIINDEFSQFKFFKKGSYYDLKSSK